MNRLPEMAEKFAGWRAFANVHELLALVDGLLALASRNRLSAYRKSARHLLELKT
jgi:hypothetical protein